MNYNGDFLTFLAKICVNISTNKQDNSVFLKIKLQREISVSKQ